MTIVVIGIAAFTPLTQASAAAQSSDTLTWNKQMTGIKGDTMMWQSVASSADGSKLVAVVAGGAVYTSTDSGTTWTERASAGKRNWTSVTSSQDGLKLFATAANDYMYASTDAGVTWNPINTSFGTNDWQTVKSSADGKNLIAMYSYGIVLSTDSGATWSYSSSAPAASPRSS